MTAGIPDPSGGTPNDDDPATAETQAAATREAKGSAQEAIGKLIGDDAARLRGAAEKEAARANGPTRSKAPPRPTTESDS
ncbi:MAG: CsbD family protein [Sphingobium sp.]